MYQIDATARAPEGLTLNNPAQARQGAVWGCTTRVPIGVPEARAFNPSVFEEFESASLRDAVAHVLTYPTQRFERGCSLRSRPHACAGLLRVSAYGTIISDHLVFDATARASEGLTLNNPSQVRQGAVWGCTTRLPIGVPEARALTHSILKEILFPYLYATLHQQSPVFLGKTNPLVMFFLSFDIVHYLVFVVDAVGEGCILVSPPIEMGESGISLEPLAGKGLDSLHILRHRYGGWERNKNMHVVGHTANAIYLSVQVVGLFHNDRIELAVVLDGDGLLATVGAKDYVIERLDITHNDKTRQSDYYCSGFESASLRDAGWLARGQPHTALRLCGVIESMCLRHNRKYDKTNSGEGFPIIKSLCLRHISRV